MAPQRDAQLTPPRDTQGPVPTPVKRRRRVTWMLVAVALVALVAAAAVAQSRSPSSSVSTGGDAPGGPGSVDGGEGTGSGVGERAPSFSVTTTSGTSFDFPTGKPTALLFLASGCPTCIEPAITLNRLERELGDRIAVLGIDINPTDTPADVARFIEAAQNPRYGFAIDGDGQLTLAFGIRAQATVVFTDSAGRIVERLEEQSDPAAFRAALAEAGLT